MESDAALAAASKPSLIVKLRHQPLCAQCTDMLPRWCKPLEQHYRRGNPPARWNWTIDELTQSSLKCHCCRFLAQVLEASPWIQREDCKMVVVETCTVGSQHMAKTPDHSVYKTYYRPMLRLNCRPKSNFCFILPVSEVHDATSEELDSSMFCSRPVNAMVDMSLVASWHKICMSRHEDSADGHGCCPNTHEFLPDFRVIDVQQRCVVRTSGKVDYAALSYVWGNAKRLVLSKDNEAWLTTPGALAQTKENVPKTFRDALEVAAALGIGNLWVDALCIDQSDSGQVENHMDAMDKIYGSAVLTIVATGEHADLGLPGISLPRGPPQAVFEYNGTRYLSSKPTFGFALRDCPWEKRAWCLQEKLFSARLLIFTDSQAFYHCGAATWFEDTIMETPESNPGTVHNRERTTLEKKRRMVDFLGRTAYDAYNTRNTAFKDRNLWSLVQSYSRREMTFEADVIRAFGGILRSVEAQHGRAIWGIPQYHFLRGLSWYHSVHRMNSRREGFPSWSWVGWHTSDNHLLFANCKRKDSDIGVMDGRYRIAQDNHDGRSVWDLAWYYYTTEEDDVQLHLRTVQLEPQDRSADPQSVHPIFAAASPAKTEISVEANIDYDHHKPVPPLASKLDMPPISHILRFYTSVATVLVHPSPIPNPWNERISRLLIPGTDIELATVNIDSLWSGIGNEHSLVYISRYCPTYYAYLNQDDKTFERLHLLLVESVPEWGEVKRRVQLVQNVSILDWRKANPRWELVSLA
jgi:hypothetical protein